MTFFAVALFFFLFGKMAEGHRWRRNADDYRRIESCGRLYKVEHDS